MNIMHVTEKLNETQISREIIPNNWTKLTVQTLSLVDFANALVLKESD